MQIAHGNFKKCTCRNSDTSSQQCKKTEMIKVSTWESSSCKHIKTLWQWEIAVYSVRQVAFLYSVGGMYHVFQRCVMCYFFKYIPTKLSDVYGNLDSVNKWNAIKMLYTFVKLEIIPPFIRNATGMGISFIYFILFFIYLLIYLFINLSPSKLWACAGKRKNILAVAKTLRTMKMLESVTT